MNMAYNKEYKLYTMWLIGVVNKYTRNPMLSFFRFIPLYGMTYVAIVLRWLLWTDSIFVYTCRLLRVSKI